MQKYCMGKFLFELIETIGKIIAFIILCIITTPIGAVIITIVISKLSQIEKNTKIRNGQQDQE